jgi:hypothetical protein
MQQPHRHTEGTVTSIIMLLVLAVVGIFGSVVLLTLALGF